MGPYYQAWPDGRSLKLDADDARRNHEEISRFSKRDADTMPRWDAWLAGLAAVLGPLLMATPPRLGSRRWSDVRDLLRLAWRHRTHPRPGRAGAGLRRPVTGVALRGGEELYAPVVVTAVHARVRE